MSNRELRRQAIQRMQTLSPQRLQVAVDFLAYLQERESNEATEELLRIPGFVDTFEKAVKERPAKRLTDWRRIRRDV